MFKKLLTVSSEFLYNATNGRAFFKNITLIVPENWPLANAIDIPACYNDAHIKVGSTDQVYGDEPYTLQPDECGKPGKFIHLSEKYVSDLYGTNDIFSRPGAYITINKVSFSIVILVFFDRQSVHP